jgi:hypothetical protein
VLDHVAVASATRRLLESDVSVPTLRASSIAVLAVLAAGCGAGSIPEPRDAALAYADAAKRGDADALYAMLGTDGRKALTRDEVGKLVHDQKDELAERAKAIEAPGVRFKTEASLAYRDGEHAALALEQGEFRIIAADALPAEAKTPTEALDQLRRVLARRSYAGLIRVLVPRARAAIEEDLRTMVEGLESPDGLEVETNGDTATVEVPGGHFVRLRREGGVWHVEDFD